MKKVFTLLVCGALAVGSLTGCSSTEKSSGSAVEEVSYCDEDFIKDMGKGLDARWAMKDDDIKMGTDEEKEFMLNNINAELKYIDKYSDKKFKDSDLQNTAETYIKLLNQDKDLCDYITVDYDKYDEEHMKIYDKRTKIISKLVDNYGLTVSDKYQDTLSKIKTNAKLVQENEAKQAAVETMLNNIQLTKYQDEFGNYKCEGYIENNTGFDFDNISLNFNFYDSEDVLVDKQSDYFTDLKDGTKAKIDLYLNSDYSYFQTSCQWWDN